MKNAASYLQDVLAPSNVLATLLKQEEQPHLDSTAEMCIYAVSKGSIDRGDEPEARAVLQSIPWDSVITHEKGAQIRAPHTMTQLTNNQ